MRKRIYMMLYVLMPEMTTQALATNVSHTTPAPSDTTKQTGGFCIMCGFNFGHIANGVDDQVMGLLLVILFVLVIVSPCIVMSCCYLCQKRGAKTKKNKKNKYKKVEPIAEEEEEEEAYDDGEENAKA